MNKFKLLLDKKVFSIFILIIAAYLAFTHNIKTAYAAVNPSGLTGAYGCMLNRNSIGYGVLWQGGSGVGITVIMNMDYSNNTSKALVTSTKNFNTANVSTKIQKITTTFVETSTGLPGTYNIVHAITNEAGISDGAASFIGIVVNSGNTILMTQVDDNQAKAPWSGVCQKI